MTKVLVDVASVRAASRLLDPDAEPPARGPFSDIDLAAASQIVEAIVFFDRVLVPNIGHHQDLTSLAEPLGLALGVLEIPEEVVGDVRAHAQTWLKECCSLDDLIRIVGAAPRYPYMGGGSETELVLSALGIKAKYGPVARAVHDLWRRDLSRLPKQPTVRLADRIIGEDRQRRVNPRLDTLFDAPAYAEELFGEDALTRILDESGLPSVRVKAFEDATLCGSGELIQFCANLIWMTYRARCYDLVALHEGVSYMPHTLRARLAGFSSFSHENYTSENDPYEPARLVDVYLKRLDKVYRQGRGAISLDLGIAMVPLETSMLMPYVVRRAQDRRHVLEVVYEIRQSAGAVNLRRRVRELHEQVAAGDVRAATDLVRELDRLTAALRTVLGIGAAPKVTMAVSIVGMAQVEAPVQIPSSFRRAFARLWPRSPSRLVFLRNVFDDLITTASSGAMYDTLFP